MGNQDHTKKSFPIKNRQKLWTILEELDGALILYNMTHLLKVVLMSTRLYVQSLDLEIWQTCQYITQHLVGSLFLM